MIFQLVKVGQFFRVVDPEVKHGTGPVRTKTAYSLFGKKPYNSTHQGEKRIVYEYIEPHIEVELVS